VPICVCKVSFVTSTAPATFLYPDNTELNVAHPLSKAALLYLQEVHPYTPDFAELLTNAAQRVQAAGGKLLRQNWGVGERVVQFVQLSCGFRAFATVLNATGRAGTS
jgi:hypothetical protein